MIYKIYIQNFRLYVLNFLTALQPIRFEDKEKLKNCTKNMYEEVYITVSNNNKFICKATKLNC